MSQIKSKEIKIIPIEKIIENPKNNNRHSVEQIDMLARLITAHGFRNPLVISNRSGFLVAGHGRLLSAKKLGLLELPVIYQDFETEAEEYQYLTSDNEIARWAELDKQAVHDMIASVPDIEIEMLGIQDFNLFSFKEEDEKDTDENDDSPKKYILEVQFKNEMEMRDIHDDLAFRGYICKVKGK